MHDVTLYHLPAWTDVDPNLQARATSPPHDLALQPPGHTRLVENLQAVGSAIDMEMKALAAALTLDIEEKTVSKARSWWARCTAEQAPKEPAHDDLQRAYGYRSATSPVSRGRVTPGANPLPREGAIQGGKL